MSLAYEIAIGLNVPYSSAAEILKAIDHGAGDDQPARTLVAALRTRRRVERMCSSGGELSFEDEPGMSTLRRYLLDGELSHA